jgi:tRNA nucleotidyltransferase (CCA-adding enzyme)
VALIGALAARLPVPTEYRELALIVARYHGIVHRAAELRAETMLDFFERADAFRRPERFALVLLACEADYRGRTGFGGRPYTQRAYLARARDAAAAVKPSAADIATGQGARIAEHLRRDRRAAIAALRPS